MTGHDRGRPLELDALTGAVAELGGRLRVPTPNIDAVLGLLQVRMGPLQVRMGPLQARTGP